MFHFQPEVYPAVHDCGRGISFVLGRFPDSASLRSFFVSCHECVPSINRETTTCGFWCSLHWLPRLFCWRLHFFDFAFAAAVAYAHGYSIPSPRLLCGLCGPSNVWRATLNLNAIFQLLTRFAGRVTGADYSQIRNQKPTSRWSCQASGAAQLIRFVK